MAAFKAAAVDEQASASARTEKPRVSSSQVMVPWLASQASKMSLITATCSLQLCPSTTNTTFGASSAHANWPWKIEVVGVDVTVVVVVGVDVAVVEVVGEEVTEDVAEDVTVVVVVGVDVADVVGLDVTVVDGEDVAEVVAVVVTVVVV